MKDGIDSITRLAMNIYSNKGVYVPLLGSGVSLAAGIMSGWKVTEDLLKKLAFMQEGNIPEDLFSWYCDKYHKEAEYSDLLSQLGHHSAEIGNLLWSYFEPTEDDKRYHRKEPTKAHKAIAEMAAKGYFKVVVTTNFDRLLEDALDQKGVKYQVVSKETDIEGVVPLVHFPLTIFKINGDYKDSRVKNTEEELSNYSKQWNDYLHGILKDFGIVTCGWSATWDKAIIKAIENCKNHKYSYKFTYVDKAN
jgi:NAD-dependent SIR2 family protein deacetylase